ncbi:MAG TPA: hypothetical protein DD490_29480 [Acidobacteria bacterium]|nr:hypothetical protein [Acidobacteriota bacterium]
MISLVECRKLLGDAGRELTDAQLERLRQDLYGLADIAVTCFLSQAQASRKAPPPQKEPSG